MTEQPPSAEKLLSEILGSCGKAGMCRFPPCSCAESIDALCAQTLTWYKEHADEAASAVVRAASTGEQPDNPPPDEPLDYIGTAPPPVGYVRLGWACPRDAALRCSGCDETDVTPDMCGSGHPAYRSQKWIAYAGRPLPFPSALASTGEQPASPAAVGDYTHNRTALELLDPVASKLTASEWDRLFDGIAAALSAVASERDAAAIRAFGQRVWSDTEDVAYQAGVSDTRARLREPDALPALRRAIAAIKSRPVSTGRDFAQEDQDARDIAALTKIAEMLK